MNKNIAVHAGIILQLMKILFSSDDDKLYLNSYFYF